MLDLSFDFLKHPVVSFTYLSLLSACKESVVLMNISLTCSVAREGSKRFDFAKRHCSITSQGLATTSKK